MRFRTDVYMTVLIRRSGQNAGGRLIALSMLFTLLIWCVSGVIPPVHAQESEGTQPPPALATTDWLAMGLSPKTVEIPSIGLSLHLPVDSGYTLQPAAQRRLEAWANDKSWIASIDVQMTADEAVTVAIVVDETIATNERQSTYLATPERASLIINGQPAERLILKMRPKAGQEEVHAMYTIFRPLRQTFVIHKVWTKVSNAAEVIKTQRSVVGSFRFSDPAAIAAARRQEVSRTVSILSRLQRENYKQILIPSRWYRIYRYKEAEEEAEEGAGSEQAATTNRNEQSSLSNEPREVAYYRIEERIGMLGEVSKTASPDSFAGMERTEGLLVSLMSRYLLLPDGSAYIDVESTAWMSFDRERERWSIRSASYVLDTTTNEYLLSDRRTMTGDRRGNRIQIVRDFPPAPAETAQLRTPLEAYVNHAEQYLLYRLLQPYEAATFGMYLYEPRLGRIAYRSETIRPGRPVQSDSKRQKDASAHLVTLNANGTIQRLEMVNGDITVPITPRDLLTIWKANNLPTGKGSQKPAGPRLSNPVTEKLEAEERNKRRR